MIKLWYDVDKIAKRGNRKTIEDLVILTWNLLFTQEALQIHALRKLAIYGKKNKIWATHMNKTKFPGRLMTYMFKDVPSDILIEIFGYILNTFSWTTEDKISNAKIQVRD